MAASSLSLNRYRLASFLACQRQFQLRYQQQVPWPAAPQDERRRVAGEQGEEFHRLLQRHFLDLPIESPGAGNPVLEAWWETFQKQRPALPEGERLVEVTLTVPVGQQLLTGRFDLLVLGEEQAHIYDWKTETTPPDEALLRKDWQTRLYLALVVEGGAALHPGQRAILPDSVTLTYWFVQTPEQPVTISYNGQWHKENWQEIQEIVVQIGRQMAQTEAWPLTADWTTCAHCVYQVLCGRAEPGRAGEADWEEYGEVKIETPLEPDYR